MTADNFIRRNRVDERWATLIAVVGGLLAAIAGAKPTGSTAIDVAIVGLSVGAVVWASASAPWWAPAAASGIAAVVAVDPLLIAIGAVGFVAGLSIGIRRRDQSEVRAIVAAIAMNVLIRSDLEGFHGLSAIIGIAVGIVLFVVGLRRRPRPYRRAGWIGLGVVGGLAVVAFLAAGIAAMSARADLTNGSSSARLAIKAVNTGDYQAAAELFQQASQRFDSADQSLGGMLATPALLVPGVAQNVAAGADLSAAAADVTQQAAAALGQVDPELLRVVDGAIDLAAVSVVEQPLIDVQNALLQLRDTTESVASPWLIGRLQDELVDLDAEMDENEPRLQDAIEAVRVAPAMLGADSPRRYLVMFTSPAELRGLAGFLGNYAEVTVDNGRIEVSKFGRRSELEDYVTEHGATCTGCSQELLDRYGSLGFTTGSDGSFGARGWSNITLPANFPYVGEAAQILYPQSGGSPIDGVISVDPYVVQALMKYTGPIEVPELGVTVDPADAATFIQETQYELAGDDGHSDRIDALDTLGQGVISALLAGVLPVPGDLARDLGPLVAEHRLLVWTDDVAEQAFLDRAGLLGAMPALTDDAGFATFVANSGASKIDVFLERSVTSEIVVEADGTRRLVADVTLTNGAPSSGLPRYVIGNAVGLPDGTSKVLVTFYGPESLLSATREGESIGVQRLPEAGWTAYSVPDVIPPGGSVSYRLEFELPAQTVADPVVAEWIQPLADRAE